MNISPPPTLDRSGSWSFNSAVTRVVLSTAAHPNPALAQVVLGIQHAGLAESLREQFRNWGVGCATADTARELAGEVESAVGRKQTVVVVYEDEFFDAGGANLRQWLGKP